MIRPIMKDVLFLAQKSEPATKADKPVIQDLLDTLTVSYTHLTLPTNREV